MPYSKLFSFAMTIFWCIVSLIGYFLLKWDLGETIIFINLGFISFFLNYFLLFSWMSFREYLVVAPRGEKGFLRIVYRFVVGIVQHCSNQFLLACAFILLSGISIVFIGLYFHLAKKITGFDVGLPEMSKSFLWLSLSGLTFTGMEFVRFYKLYAANRTNLRLVFDWDALKVFHENHRKKLYVYYFGSVFAIIIDSGIGSAYMGVMSLIWLFLLNVYWAFVDFRFPVGRKRTAIEEEV